MKEPSNEKQEKTLKSSPEVQEKRKSPMFLRLSELKERPTGPAIVLGRTIGEHTVSLDGRSKTVIVVTPEAMAMLEQNQVAIQLEQGIFVLDFS